MKTPAREARLSRAIAAAQQCGFSRWGPLSQFSYRFFPSAVTRILFASSQTVNHELPTDSSLSPALAGITAAVAARVAKHRVTGVSGAPPARPTSRAGSLLAVFCIVRCTAARNRTVSVSLNAALWPHGLARRRVIPSLRLQDQTAACTTWSRSSSPFREDLEPARRI